MAYNGYMSYNWDSKKNEELKREGRPSFEEALEALANNGALVDDKNPGHPGQRIYVVLIRDYPYVIPYEIRGDVRWLITVFPSRKFKR